MSVRVILCLSVCVCAGCHTPRRAPQQPNARITKAEPQWHALPEPDWKPAPAFRASAVVPASFVSYEVRQSPDLSGLTLEPPSERVKEPAKLPVQKKPELAPPPREVTTNDPPPLDPTLDLGGPVGVWQNAPDEKPAPLALPPEPEEDALPTDIVRFLAIALGLVLIAVLGNRRNR